MSGMRGSLRVQLGVTLSIVLAVVVTTFAVALHAMTARALLNDLDERLAGDASAVAGMVEQGENGTPEVEYESLRDFETGSAPAYYEIWLDDGRVLNRSPSLSARSLARNPGVSLPRYRDVILPDGRPGRSIEIRTAARLEDAPIGAVAPTGAEQRVTIAVARGTQPIAETMVRVRAWLWALALMTILTGSGAVFFALSRGLRPVEAYAGALAQLDGTRLRTISAASRLPFELDPIRNKLDELLARLAESFARERRFTADVAHELRTPIAAIRTILDVALTRERSGADYRAAIAEAAQVTKTMQILIDDLLLMSRLDNGQIQIARRPVVLRDLVDECWSPLAVRACERGLTFSNRVDPTASVQTDPDKLKIIVSNLLSNAAEYTVTGGRIAVRGSLNSSDRPLEVWDSGPELPPNVLPRMFDRFFRADLARAADRGHAGIGLALVKSVADVLDLDVTAHNAAEGGVALRVAQRSGALQCA